MSKKKLMLSTVLGLLIVSIFLIVNKPVFNAHTNFDFEARAGKQVNTLSKIVVINAGHQMYGNYEKEPIGPNAIETKYKVSGGTVGRITGKPEYELTLEIAKKLQNELNDRGYTAILIRSSNKINISNSERAAIANNLSADALVHIHANGSENIEVNGMMAICQTSENPYTIEMYDKSYKLAAAMLEYATAATGAHKEHIWETDTMSSINWSEVPTSIIEVGYMTNEKEEQLLITEEYQDKIAIGIANGIDAYFRS